MDSRGNNEQVNEQEWDLNCANNIVIIKYAHI